MKDKIMYLIIGALIGAIITAGCFLLFGKNNKKGMRGEPGQMQMDGNMTRPDGTIKGNRGQNTLDDGNNTENTNTSNT